MSCRVFWAVFPWDGGTRPSDRPMYEELTELIVQTVRKTPSFGRFKHYK